MVSVLRSRNARDEEAPFLAQVILEGCPGIQEYREPFLLDGSLLLRLRDDAPEALSFWGNNPAYQIRDFYAELRDRPEDLVAELLRARAQAHPASMVRDVRRGRPAPTALERAVDCYVSYEMASGLTGASAPSRGWPTKATVESLSSFSPALLGAGFTGLPYQRVLEEPGDDVLVYIDLADVGSRKFNFELLFQSLKGCQHTWLMSAPETTTLRNFIRRHRLPSLRISVENLKLNPGGRGNELLVSNSKQVVRAAARSKRRELRLVKAVADLVPGWELGEAIHRYSRETRRSDRRLAFYLAERFGKDLSRQKIQWWRSLVEVFPDPSYRESNFTPTHHHVALMHARRTIDLEPVGTAAEARFLMIAHGNSANRNRRLSKREFEAALREFTGPTPRPPRTLDPYPPALRRMLRETERAMEAMSRDEARLARDLADQTAAAAIEWKVQDEYRTALPAVFEAALVQTRKEHLVRRRAGRYRRLLRRLLFRAA